MRIWAAFMGVLLCGLVAAADERSEGIAKAEASTRAVAALAKADPTRPIFHVAPEAYWTNDPNGPLLLNGSYHLFSQHNPYGNDWGHMHWAHFTSPDLVHWRHAGIALWPSLSRGEEHCFSGSAIVGPDGLPRMFYTSIGPKTPADTGAEQWMAIGDAGGMHWEKSPKNPVMTLKLHGDLAVRDWRDPYVWKEGNEYLCVLGGEHEGKGAAYLYASADLEAWAFRGVLCEEPEAGRKGSWECPNFFRIGDTWVLIISRDGVRYFTGDFDIAAGTFTPKHQGTLDLGTHYYAPNGLLDAQGRHVLWGWATGLAGDHWNNCLTLPRALTVSTAGMLRSTPVPELAGLRSSPLPPGSALAPSCEIEITIPRGTRGLSGIRLENGGKEHGTQTFAVDWNANEVLLGAKRYPLGERDGDAMVLRVFIDRSLVEVYLGDGRALTEVWPGNGQSKLTLETFAEDAAAKPTVQAWNLAAIWQD